MTLTSPLPIYMTAQKYDGDKFFKSSMVSSKAASKWRITKKSSSVLALIFVIITLCAYFPDFFSLRVDEAEFGIIEAAEDTPAADLIPTIWTKRQQRIADAFFHSWDNYKEYAWGLDILKPISKSSEQWFYLGLTIIDSFDTLHLIGRTDERSKAEFELARKWLEHDFKAESSEADINLFETTIRVMYSNTEEEKCVKDVYSQTISLPIRGGFLSTYYLTNDSLFLEKANMMAEKMMPAFTDSPTVIPLASVNLGKGKGVGADGGMGASSTAEVTTIQIEFTYLSHLIDDDKYRNLAVKVMDHMLAIEPTTSLVPIFINPHTAQFQGSEVRLGSRGDSYYEYLYKQFHQTSHSEPRYKDMWLRAWTSVKNWLIDITPNEGLMYIGEWHSVTAEVTRMQKELPTDPLLQLHERESRRKQGLGSPSNLSPKMDHLVCFMPGTILLSVTGGKTIQEYTKETPLTEIEQEDLYIASELMATCYKMYTMQPTLLAPEIAMFHTARNSEETSDMYVKPLDRHNLMRPETVESLFYFWRITRNETYREWGWNIWENGFEKYSKVEHGYTSLEDVSDASGGSKRDKMETYWMSETLKYFYLLFDEDETLLPLDKVVFNTEGHPFPVFDLT